jgi:hypothetical protein
MRPLGAELSSLASESRRGAGSELAGVGAVLTQALRYFIGLYTRHHSLPEFRGIRRYQASSASYVRQDLRDRCRAGNHVGVNSGLKTIAGACSSRGQAGASLLHGLLLQVHELMKTCPQCDTGYLYARVSEGTATRTRRTVLPRWPVAGEPVKCACFGSIHQGSGNRSEATQYFQRAGAAGCRKPVNCCGACSSRWRAAGEYGRTK